jgi:hypothetical protein
MGMMMGKMGMMRMGKMGMMMGMMGMKDEAAAVGDPHLTTLSGEKKDLCCEGSVCKPCEQSLLQMEATGESTADPMDYIGCYKDDGARDLKNGPRQYGYTSESCRTTCSNQGYSYFSLQNGGWCACDNAYNTQPKYAKVGDNECGAVCNGEAGLSPARYCGAGWRNAVYATEPARDDAAAVADPHMESTEGSNSDLCCHNGHCSPCDNSLAQTKKGRGKMGMMMGMRGKMGMMMGKMGMMRMGKIGMMMGMMGMKDEAAAVGDPHLTTLSGEKQDLCCKGSVCKPCEDAF